MEKEFQLQKSKIKSKNKSDNLTINTLDNDTMEHKFEIQKSKSESKYKKKSTLRIMWIIII